MLPCDTAGCFREERRFAATGTNSRVVTPRFPSLVGRPRRSFRLLAIFMACFCDVASLFHNHLRRRWNKVSRRSDFEYPIEHLFRRTEASVE